MIPPPILPTWSIEAKLHHAFGSDRTLSTILKGHLVLENAIQTSCEKKLTKPSAILKERGPSFATKVDLLESLFGDEIASEAYLGCRTLNKLRNELAHKLESSAIDRLQAQLLELTLPSMPSVSPENRVAMPPDELTERLFYKIHAIIRDILQVSMAGEIADFEIEMQAWLDKTR